MKKYKSRIQNNIPCLFFRRITLSLSYQKLTLINFPNLNRSFRTDHTFQLAVNDVHITLCT